MLPGWLALLGGLEPPTLTVQAGGSWMPGQTPPFQDTARDRAQGEAGLLWVPDDEVRLGLSVDGWRADRYADGSRIAGPGDITMITDVVLWRGPVDLGAGFAIKQPNADDERALGTDETDISLVARAGADVGVRLEAAGGVTFAGDPRRYTAHDRIPALALSAALPTDWGAVRLISGGGLATAHNPARLTARLGVLTACPLRLSADVLLGLTAAAPDWGLSAAVGWCHG